jgi:predicted RNA methylase
MHEQCELIPGTNRDTTLSQWFTPPDLAARVVEWARIDLVWRDRGRDMVEPAPMRVLEPSAGNGALVRPLVAAGAHVTAVELDLRYVQDLANVLGLGNREHRMAVPCDFLELDPRELGPHDLCVTNPPYENGLDVAFILHALKFAPRVVGIFQAGIEYGVDRHEALWAHVRPTRMLKLKRRWFKAQDGKGGQTNYVVLELVKRCRADASDMCGPDNVTIEWW